MENAPDRKLSFLARLWMALAVFFRIVFQPDFAQRVRSVLDPGSKQETLPGPTPSSPRILHASGLFVLSLLQREGRLLDFVEEDITTASDANVGAAARIVHAGCRKVLDLYVPLQPVLEAAEGSVVTVPQGFDANRIRLVGRVAGSPPFSGSLKHHGWRTQDVRLPEVPDALDTTVLAPAEVELS
jgi:hypothetical protein